MRTKLFAILTQLVIGAAAIAQTAPAAGPPLARTPDQPKTWLYYVVIAVLLGATVAISVMPSKRGHQD